MPMEERKKKILQVIVENYISTAEPVGSRTIARKYNLGISPATIRNEMSDLEEMGYLEQLHTSSGRVPSDKGYRFYVDCIMEKHQISKNEEQFIAAKFDNKMGAIENVIKETSNILSHLTQYTAVVMGPYWGCDIFKYIQLFPLDNHQALMLIVTKSGVIHHQIVGVPESISEKDLNRISMVLNSTLKGVAIEKVKKSVLDEIYNELLKEKLFVNTILEILETTLREEKKEKIYLEGTLNILNQPEFRDIGKIKSILRVLDEEEILRKLLHGEEKNDLSVKIGEENELKEVHDCSLIRASYYVDNNLVGSIGILGPTRMKYSKTISVVEYITKMLSEELNK